MSDFKILIASVLPIFYEYQIRIPISSIFHVQIHQSLHNKFYKFPVEYIYITKLSFNPFQIQYYQNPLTPPFKGFDVVIIKILKFSFIVIIDGNMALSLHRKTRIIKIKF